MSPSLDRVLIVGTSCAGKSTFSRNLSTLLGQQPIELDALYWGPNWRPKAAHEFLQSATEAAADSRWVVDGNYRTVREIFWPRATLVVWLNYSFPTVLWRAVRRTMLRAVTREPLWHGNRESFKSSFFSRDSILLWVVTTFHRRQREFSELRASGTYTNLAWLEFRHPDEAQRFLDTIQGSSRRSTRPCA